MLSGDTHFKEYVLIILRDFDSKVSFRWLVREVKSGTSYRRWELNAVVEWILVASQVDRFSTHKTASSSSV